ncbi:MAG: hypothetical protein RLZZ568_797, partial [Cyanobacteriota bacterium]
QYAHNQESYLTLLNAFAHSDEYAHVTARTHVDWITYLKLLQSFTASAEFKQKQSWEATEYQDYIRCLYQILLKRDPSPDDLKQYAHNQESYLTLLNAFAHSDEYAHVTARTHVDLTAYLGCSTAILGQTEPISPALLLGWYRRIALALLQKSDSRPVATLAGADPPVVPSASPLVTIITSLYRGEDYLPAFLANITQQTCFEHCQLWIVDAHSPEHEYNHITPYLERFPHNIVYDRRETRIGIYEAWNYVIENSDSPFITNANVDDCHRPDAIERKLQALREHPAVDVVYSDVYYSFLPNLPFAVIEQGGVRTQLPKVDLENLRQFNSPHNAPLWRRDLHQTLGLFDTQYQSAGDWEFWLRAAQAGRQFLKIDPVVSAYYHNPQGLSTRFDGIARQERRHIQDRYSAPGQFFP